MNKRTLPLLACVLALVLFLALNMAANAGLRSMRLDLTEDKIFTLDEGSKAIAKTIEEPINLYFYYSRGVARDYPSVTDYAERILGMLHEFERSSNGNIRLQVIDPDPFSEEEDQAVEQGVQGAPVEAGGVLYFGLVGTSSTDQREVIPFFALDADKQRTLEYDLSKLIWTLSHPDKKKVGILSALQLEGGGGMPMMGQPGQPRWAILDQLGDYFDVEVLPSTTEDLGKIDILVVVHPRGFTDKTLYLVDQWALAGKPLVVFVDPQCEVDPGDGDPTNQMSRFTAKKDSDMEKLFKAWGFELAKNKVACDKVYGMRQPVPSRDRRTQTEIPVVFLMQLGEKSTNHDDPVTRLLKNVLVWTAGSLHKLPDATTTFTPLLETSEESEEADSSQFQIQPDAQQLLASFVPGYQKLVLAARVTGDVKTAFPDGKPGAPQDGEPTDAPKEDTGTPPAAGLTASTQPLNLLVFADADLLHDRLWMRELRFGNQSLVALTSENMDLVRNAIDSAGGGKELMGIHLREKTTRPFERVQEIQRDADQRYLAEQKELERKVQDYDQKLKELESAKADGTEELVTAEQKKERTRVREEFVQTRKDLRNVQYNLGKDIRHLGTMLGWINIGLMPLLVSSAAIGLGVWRKQQRGRKDLKR